MGNGLQGKREGNKQCDELIQGWEAKWVCEFLSSKTVIQEFLILLDSGCSSTIVNKGRTKALRNKYTHLYYTKWITQAGNIMTN